MDKIVISFFLIFINIFILTYKYLNEAPIIEKFYENEPKLSLDELRILSKVAHSFVKGEPLKIPHNLLAPQFYIANKLINAHSVDSLRYGVSKSTQNALFQENAVTMADFYQPLTRPPPDLILSTSGDQSWNVASNPLSLGITADLEIKKEKY